MFKESFAYWLLLQSLTLQRQALGSATGQLQKFSSKYSFSSESRIYDTNLVFW